MAGPLLACAVASIKTSLSGAVTGLSHTQADQGSLHTQLGSGNGEEAAGAAGQQRCGCQAGWRNGGGSSDADKACAGAGAALGRGAGCSQPGGSAGVRVDRSSEATVGAIKVMEARQER